MMKGKQIFIVEDDTMNRVVYTMILKKEGIILEFDRFGRDTIAKLKQAKYDLIILDLMLPRGDSGFNIFEKIRQVSEYATVPIVAISASDPSHAIPKAQALGFNGFIAKPLDKDRFSKQLMDLLDGKEVWYAGERL
jgi:CheY-like chemotaxis protein